MNWSSFARWNTIFYTLNSCRVAKTSKTAKRPAATLLLVWPCHHLAFFAVVFCPELRTKTSSVPKNIAIPWSIMLQWWVKLLMCVFIFLIWTFLHRIWTWFFLISLPVPFCNPGGQCPCPDIYGDSTGQLPFFGSPFYICKR